MDEIRHWWATTLKGFLDWLGTAWDTFVRGVQGNWDIRYFVLGMACILVVGLFTVWRRRA